MRQNNAYKNTAKLKGGMEEIQQCEPWNLPMKMAYE